MESLLAQARGQAQQQGGQQEQQDQGKLLDLTSSVLEKKDCYARNESSAYPMTNLFIGDTRLGCKSDADEQLILHIAFNQTVKVCQCLSKPYTRKNIMLFLSFIKSSAHIPVILFFFL